MNNLYHVSNIPFFIQKKKNYFIDFKYFFLLIEFLSNHSLNLKNCSQIH